MWLLRGLLFTHQALHTAQRDPNTELADAFNKGYEASLKRHHNFIVKGIFSVCFVSLFLILFIFARVLTWYACICGWLLTIASHNLARNEILSIP